MQASSNVTKIKTLPALYCPYKCKNIKGSLHVYTAGNHLLLLTVVCFV